MSIAERLTTFSGAIRNGEHADNNGVDPVAQFLKEISVYPRLTKRQIFQRGIDVFVGRVVLKGLIEVAEIRHLSDEQRQFIGDLVTNLGCKTLLEGFSEGDDEYRYAKNGAKKIKKSQEKRNLTPTIIIGERFGLWLVKKIGTTSEIQDGKLRYQLTERILNKEALLVYKALNSHEELVVSHLGLVVSVAKEYRNRGLDFLDLIQFGNIGLIRAATLFDFRMKNRLSTSAVRWIRQAIQRGIQNSSKTIRIPQSGWEAMGKFQPIAENFVKAYGHEPTIEEARRYVNGDKKFESETLEYALKVSRVESINQIVSAGDGETELGEFLKGYGDVEEEADRIIQASQVREALSCLTPRQRKVVELRFGFYDSKPRTLDMVGRALGITRERARQIEAEALAKLRQDLRVLSLIEAKFCKQRLEKVE